jgi:acyl-CoA thioesterase
MSSALHPLDLATQLTPLEEGRFRGRITPAYANMVGPFGGTIAAVMLNGPLLDPRRLGEPVSLTVNFAGPIADADFEVTTRVARTNRSTQHWIVELSQDGEVAVTATALFAVRRETWSDCELPFPDVPAPEAVPVANFAKVTPWVNNYQIRPIDGILTFNSKDIPSHSQSTLWIRDEPPRPLDFVALTSMADAFFPRIFVRQQKPCPAGTVSMTLYFHADGTELAALGSSELLGRARAQQYRNGFLDQTAELWSEDGRLLVSSNQLVYYKL